MGGTSLKRALTDSHRLKSSNDLFEHSRPGNGIFVLPREGFLVLGALWTKSQIWPSWAVLGTPDPKNG